jgi:hypothetical protein
MSPLEMFVIHQVADMGGLLVIVLISYLIFNAILPKK